MWRKPNELEHGADLLPLDWASVGRCVRRWTLEAVALHFATLGVVDPSLPDESTPDEEASE